MKRFTGILIVFAFLVAIAVGTVAMADKPLKPCHPGPDKDDCYYIGVGFCTYYCCVINDEHKCWLLGCADPY